MRTHLSVVGFAPAARRYCTEPSPDGGNAVRECHALLIKTKSRTRSREDRPRVGERVGLVPFRRDHLQRQGTSSEPEQLTLLGFSPGSVGIAAEISLNLLTLR